MKAVIVAGGEHDPGDERALIGADLVIAADSGANWLDAVGVQPDRLIGDLDSADPAVVDRLRAAGVVVEQHPVDKDASDLELSLEWALRQGADEIVVLGWGGGAVDHLAANLLVLAIALPTGTTLRLSAGPNTGPGHSWSRSAGHRERRRRSGQPAAPGPGRWGHDQRPALDTGGRPPRPRIHVGPGQPGRDRRGHRVGRVGAAAGDRDRG